MQNFLARFARPFAALAAVVALGTTTSACIVETHDHGPAYARYPGVAVFDWTLDLSKNPASCSQSAAVAIEITIYASSGAALGSYQQDCASFSTSITLDPGTYTASALLIDAANQARTTTLNIDPFTTTATTRCPSARLPADGY